MRSTAWTLSHCTTSSTWRVTICSVNSCFTATQHSPVQMPVTGTSPATQHSTAYHSKGVEPLLTVVFPTQNGCQWPPSKSSLSAVKVILSARWSSGRVLLTHVSGPHHPHKHIAYFHKLNYYYYEIYIMIIIAIDKSKTHRGIIFFTHKPALLGSTKKLAAPIEM